MKQHLNICNIYIFLWCLYYLQGTLYTSGGIISQGILAILLIVSLYYFFVANITLRTPSVIKALNIFIIMLTLYGLLYAASGKIIIIQYTGLSVGAIGYLKEIYVSILPIYAFYAFTSAGLLTETTIRKWFFVFLAVVTASYFREERETLQMAMMEGSMQEEFTNNTGYKFLSLIPMLFFFHKNRAIQYLALAYIMAFIIMGMKRGAIIIGAIIVLWFFFHTLKHSPRKTRFKVVLLIAIIIVATSLYVANMLETSEYFQHRIEQTQEGATSDRDVIFTKLFSYFINETSTWNFYFGSGANHTVAVAGNYAHNDWLELAVNQGCLGILVYLIYWICMYKTWRNSKSNSIIYSSLGAICVIFFLSTFFSMSYGSMSIYATLCLGYCLASNYVVAKHDFNLQNKYVKT